MARIGLAALRAEADEIVTGKVRLFGSAPVPLELAPPTPLRHWTAYEGRAHDLGDLKFIWEPARFGWAFTLGRAYWLTRDERYPEAFWRYFETHSWMTTRPTLAPTGLPPRRLPCACAHLVFAAQVFAASRHSTPAAPVPPG